jgi:hypothetical protein
MGSFFVIGPSDRKGEDGQRCSHEAIRRSPDDGCGMIGASIRPPLRNHHAIPMWNRVNRRTRITSRVFVDTSCTRSAIVIFGSRTHS